MLDFLVRQKNCFGSVHFSVKYTLSITHNMNLLKATLILEDVSHSIFFSYTKQSNRLVLTSPETRVASIPRVTEFASGGCRKELFISSPVSRGFHSLIHSQVLTESNIVLPLSISSTLCFPEGHLVLA
jgi:hypothetical protein